MLEEDLAEGEGALVIRAVVGRIVEAEVKGLNAFPRDQWPDNIALLYYSYHIMVGLGTIFIAIMVVAAFLLWRRKLFDATLDVVGPDVGSPFPYIANTAGWITAELGRQPWLVYWPDADRARLLDQRLRGNGLFTLLGFMGMYTLLSDPLPVPPVARD